MIKKKIKKERRKKRKAFTIHYSSVIELRQPPPAAGRSSSVSPYDATDASDAFVEPLKRRKGEEEEGKFPTLSLDVW